jgi:hypothetical protein
MMWYDFSKNSILWQGGGMFHLFRPELELTVHEDILIETSRFIHIENSIERKRGDTCP